MSDTRERDAQLVAAAREGDRAALESLIRAHTAAVYAHALRFFGDGATAEDAAQEVFVKVFRSLDSFDGTAAFSTWLYRVTRNTCLDMIRAGKRRPVPVDPVDISADPVGDFADASAATVSVEAAMRALAPEDRDALSAVALFGLTYADAADVLGVPAGTVKSRVFRARRTLAAVLGSGGGS
jgi:RNA polymerase sigma-70 factor (ECF subfamily)